MLIGHDQERGPNFRRTALGLVIVVATVTADLAAFVGPINLARVALFSLAGLLAAAVALASPFSKKTV